MPHIYLDYAATTPTDPRVVQAMQKYWSEEYGNPSSLYALGQSAKRALNNSRDTIGKFLNCQADEIIFTGGGTESINLALKGLLMSANPDSHLITSAIEHHAVLHVAQRLKKMGYQVSILPVDEFGLVNISDLEKAITENTVLVSIMMANNEVGTIQPIQKFGTLISKLNKTRKNKIYFHTDACQATGALDLDVVKLHVDLLTINASKIYGPKGVGVLYAKRGTPLTPLIDGGGQENSLRSGTENIPGIVGLAKALELIESGKARENKRLTELRDWLIHEILTKIDKTRLNGHADLRLPNNINISILDVEGEAMLLYLDEVGVQASTGSACDSATLDPSHVIRALGNPYEAAHGSMRFSLGKYTTRQDLEYLMSKLPGIVETLRQTSPVKVNMQEVETAIKNAPREIIEL